MVAGRQDGRLPELHAAFRDRARRPARVDAVHRLPEEPRRHPRPERGDRPRQRHVPAGERSRADPADRRATGEIRDDRAHRRLRDARQGLAHAGVARGARRPRRRRAVPALALPLPRPCRGDRPRNLRSLLLRGDPALQRHADAAGLRRPDPHDRRRGRRERRRLRTHQGRGARRQVRARRDRRGLRQGLPHDSRRERRHCDHRTRAVPDRSDCSPASAGSTIRASWAPVDSRPRSGCRSTS